MTSIDIDPGSCPKPVTSSILLVATSSCALENSSTVTSNSDISTSKPATTTGTTTTTTNDDTFTCRTSGSRVSESQRRQSLFLVGLVGKLTLATFLAVLFIPRDHHTPRMMHPLSSIKLAEPQSHDSIRYLTFGSSSTWGEGLEDPSRQAYPWLLSPTVHNAAVRVGGLSLSAICTQSIVGEGIYDVIVVEFMDEDAEGLVHLAWRLRERFPEASMVFVRLWSPATHIVYNDTPLLTWWKQQQQQQLKSPALSKFSASTPNNAAGEEGLSTGATLFRNFDFQSAVLSSDPDQWSFRDFSAQATSIDEVVADVEGFLFNLPFPNTRQPIPFVLNSPQFMNMFQESNAHVLSEHGHQLVANGIRVLLQDENILQRPNRNEVGSWGNGDACSMWYATGDYSPLRSRRRASLVDFSRENDGLHKHAVEISRRGGSLEVTNPFSEPRMLYLTYMTAISSQRGAREYPRTKVSLDGKASVLIDPVHDQPGADREHHLTRTTAVGMVRPGRTVLRLDCLDAESSSRFRLVGLHFLNKGKVPIPFEFSLEADTAHR